MKLRIISGRYRSHRFDAPGGFATHPMGDRVRTALFNKIGDMEGFEVLDPFAGSGAICFEAISRGAEKAVAIERDRRAQAVIKRNIESLHLEQQVHLVKANCRTWSKNNQDRLFDLIICDPPYNDFKPSTLALMVKHLREGGLMVVSQPGRERIMPIPGVTISDHSSYGDAVLVFYRL